MLSLVSDVLPLELHAPMHGDCGFARLEDTILVAALLLPVSCLCVAEDRSLVVPSQWLTGLRIC